MALQRFDNIIGQKGAVRFLQNAMRTGHVPHALILCGERGIGKMDLAMAFAGALQCTQRPARTVSSNAEEALPDPDGTQPPAHMQPPEASGDPWGAEPCGRCRACKQIAAGSHPDVIVVTNARAGAETKTNTIGVKAARFVQTDVSIKPYEGPYKIYIIPDAQNMNAQAQNALLKTLEEPPAYAVLILLAQTTAAFLPTVLSRCVTLNLRPVSEEELVTDLVNRADAAFLPADGTDAPGRTDSGGRAAADRTGSAPDRERAVLCARLSRGNPGRCRQLSEDETLWTFRADFISFMKRMPDVNSYEIVQYAESLTAKGENRADDFLDFGLAWFRDILASKSADTAGTLIFADEITYINKVKDQLSYAALGRILGAFDDAARRRAARGNDTQILEVLLLNVRRAMSRR